MKRLLIPALCCLGLFSNPAPGLAQAAPPSPSLTDRIEQLQLDTDANPFELGMMQTLRAFEKLLLARHQYDFSQASPFLHLLRAPLSTQTNPTPKPLQPDTLATLAERLLTDVTLARTTLEQIDNAEAFEFSLQDLWFDLNGDGKQTPEEDAALIVAGLMMGQGEAQRALGAVGQGAGPLTICFDAADHDWLLAYTHLVSGGVNAFLAFDPTPVAVELRARKALLAKAPEIENIYDPAAIRAELASLEQTQSEVRAQLKKTSDELDANRKLVRDLQNKAKELETGQEKDQLNAAVVAATEGMDTLSAAKRDLRQQRNFLRAEISSAKAKLPPKESTWDRPILQEPDADMIYITLAALQQQPNEARVQAAALHWRSMITHNQMFWDKLEQETDNDREWIPNARQDSVLPVTLPPGAAKAWRNVLQDASDVLDGKLLVRHPLLPQRHGVQCRRLGQ